MQGKGFILPDRERIPSVFEAMVLFFFACAGRILASYIGGLMCRAASYFMYGITDTFTQMFSSAVYYVLFLILPIAVCAKRNPGIHEYMRIRPLSGQLSCLCAVAGLLGMAFVTYLSYLWMIPIQELGGTLTGSSLIIPPSTQGKVFSVLTDAVMPGICEELLFRGILLGSLEERGSKNALVIVAFMFASLHGSVCGLPSEIISGLILGFIVISTDSLFAGMIYHMVHNAAILIISFVQKSDGEQQERLFTAVGGASGIVRIALLILLCGSLLMLVLSRIDKRRADRPFGVEGGGHRSPGVPELTVIGSCAAVIVMFYVIDVLRIAGVYK